VDVAVYLDEQVDGDRYKLLLPILRDIQSTLRHKEVDLLCLNTVPPDLAFSVLEHGKRLYSRDEIVRARAETAIMSRYYDEAPADDEYYRFMEARILAGKWIERTPDMIDKKSIDKRIAHMSKRVEQLNQFRRMTLEEFLDDTTANDLAARELQTCVEAMADICTHIVAALGLEKPRERSDAPLILSRAQILPKELAQYLSEAIGLRNILVHGYIDIEYARVYEVIPKELGYFEDFSQHITRYLQKIEQRQAKRWKKK
jgi:uncharacterized protein YutE (UPF0331/DUF86 family)